MIGIKRSSSAIRHRYLRIVNALKKKHPLGKEMEEHDLIELWLNSLKKKRAIKRDEELKEQKNAKVMEIIQKEVEWKMHKIKGLVNLGKDIEREIVFLDKCG